MFAAVAVAAEFAAIRLEAAEAELGPTALVALAVMVKVVGVSALVTAVVAKLQALPLAVYVPVRGAVLLPL